MIKPSWYTITELKKQRNFTVTKHDTKNYEKEVQERLDKEYKIYETRIRWERVMQRNNYINAEIQDRMLADGEPPPADEKTEKEIQDIALKRAKQEEHRMDTKEVYKNKYYRKIAGAGEYKLCAV